MHNEGVVGGYVLPGLPHILLAPEKNPGWQKVRKAYESVRRDIEKTDADFILYYSTYWPSILGHQVQANPKPKWTHVDDQFHALGSIDYEFKVETNFAENYVKAGQRRGLHMRSINYDGFPIDTGVVVAQKLINPNNKYEVGVVSSNIYSDRAETIVLGKAAADAIKQTGKKAVVVVVTSLSNRLHTQPVDPAEDRIHSLKDQEWNDKYLELLKEGRVEDVSQLSRQFHSEARIKKVTSFKPFWWFSAVMGANNNYEGHIYEYQPIMGTGAAVIGVVPSQVAKASDLEFDEDNVEEYLGDRNVLDSMQVKRSQQQRQTSPGPNYDS